MGFLDHQKQWDFIVNATPDACLAAFAGAMAGKSGLNLRKAKWDVSRAGSRAVAEYRGRGGLGAGVAVLSRRVAEVEEVAIGSKLEFKVSNHDRGTGTTECSLWLAQRGTQFGLTADAGFFRSYMNEVERALRAMDQGLRVSKG
jgi:hypothetical protein